MTRVLADLVYSGLGFVLGYFVGRLGTDMNAIRWERLRPMLGVIILFLTVYTVVTNMRTAQGQEQAAAHDRQVILCQTLVNEQLIEALQAGRDAQREMLKVTVDLKTTQAARYAAVQKYLGGIDAAPLPKVAQCGS